MIRFEHVYKSFDGSTNAVEDLCLDVREGETLVLLGSSGSGKTTSLKMVNRLIEPTSGAILVNGKDVMEQNPVSLRRSIGYVFQKIGLFPHMRILENVEIVPKLLGWPVQQRRERAYQLLEMIGLPPENYANRYPDELSGGERQRIGVARALAANPDYLLMDEPFGALDALTRDTLQQELIALKAKIKKTIVFVTHDIFEALTLADRLAIMHAGRLEQVGTKEEILGRPETPFVQDLFAKPARQLAGFQEMLT